MQPKTAGIKQNWRTFHPQASVIIQNPFDHDVVFQVADETNTPYQYRLQAGKMTELPGGSVATLGVKAIVDQMIQNDNNLGQMWSLDGRKKYEDQIIVREKAAPQREVSQQSEGVKEVTLQPVDFNDDDSKDAPADELETDEEAEFPGLKPTPKAEKAGKPKPGTGFNY